MRTDGEVLPELHVVFGWNYTLLCVGLAPYGWTDTWYRFHLFLKTIYSMTTIKLIKVQGSELKAENSMISFFFEFIIIFLLHLNWVSSIPFSYCMRLPFYLFYIYASFPFLFPITQVYHFIYILGVRSIPVPSPLSLPFYFS